MTWVRHIFGFIAVWLTLHSADATKDGAQPRSSLLKSALAAGGLNQPNQLTDILSNLGLTPFHSLRILNTAEHSELTESLKDAGINLGSRSLLRYLASRTVYRDVVRSPVADSDDSMPERTEHQLERRSSKSIEESAPGSHEGRRLQVGLVQAARRDASAHWVFQRVHDTASQRFRGTADSGGQRGNYLASGHHF